jgi:hypothetical protein
MEEWRYNTEHPQPQNGVEVSGQICAPAALPVWERIHGIHWVGRRAVLDTVEKSLPLLPEIGFLLPGHLFLIQVTIPTELSWLLL